MEFNAHDWLTEVTLYKAIVWHNNFTHTRKEDSENTFGIGNCGLFDLQCLGKKLNSKYKQGNIIPCSLRFRCLLCHALSWQYSTVHKLKSQRHSRLCTLETTSFPGPSPRRFFQNGGVLRYDWPLCMLPVWILSPFPRPSLLLDFPANSSLYHQRSFFCFGDKSKMNINKDDKANLCTKGKK